MNVCLQPEALAAALRQLDYEVESFPLFEHGRNTIYEKNISHDHFMAWVPRTGVLPEFDPVGFCGALPGNVLFVGDSVSDGQYRLLQFQLGGLESSHTDWYPAHLEEFNTRVSTISFKACNGTKLFASIRNDWIDARVPGSSYGSPTNGMRNCMDGVINAYCTPWLHEDLLNSFRVLVLNSGAHFRPDASYAAGLSATVQGLARYSHLHLHTIFRTTAAGYEGCHDHADDPPFASLQQAEDFLAAHPWYNSAKFSEQNRIATDIFRGANFSVLDVYPSSAMRLDGHRDGGGDCLHYRVPGLMPHWNRLLYAELKALD